MAKLASFFDEPMETAENGGKTHHDRPEGKAGHSSNAPWLIDYLNDTTPPDDRVIVYRQLVGSKWVWGTTVHPNATIVNPYSRRALRNREALGRDVPGIEFVQAPAIKGSKAA